jgi:AcrR family transcriptional regulator
VNGARSATAADAPAATPRGRERRRRLLDATAVLVAERGFHSVGIADIGAAAGVTGSAIYRHFQNKDELLVALFDRVLDELVERARAAVASTTDPCVALRELVAAHADFALANRAVISVYGQEEINLPPDDRRRLRRKLRVYVQMWADALGRARPALAPAEQVATVSATIGLVNSVAAFSTPLADAELRALVVAMALRALHAPELVPAP